LIYDKLYDRFMNVIETLTLSYDNDQRKGEKR